MGLVLRQACYSYHVKKLKRITDEVHVNDLLASKGSAGHEYLGMVT